MAIHRSKERNELYLKWMYSIILITILFYTLKYNFVYHIYKYNFVLITGVAFFTLCGPLYFFTKKYNLVANLMLFISTFLVSFFVFTAGGMGAPGIFWLSIYPFIGGILLGRNGSYAGGVIMAISYGIFMVLEQFNQIPRIDMIENFYEREKTFNILIFSITSFLTTLYFLKNEEKAQQTVEDQKKEIEILLRILMHDVATPVTAILGSVKLINKNSEQSENLRKYIDIIDKSTQAIMNMLFQMKNISAIKDGKINIKGQLTSVNDIILSTVEMVRHRADNKKINIKIELDTSDPKIIIDPDFFKISILSNLLTNAIKFSHESGQITISSEVKGSMVCIQVKDQGIGIPTTLLKNIFNISAKTTRAGTNGEKGTGYGMPIMKTFIEKLGGSVQVESVEKNSEGIPSGTTFTLCFNIAK